MFNLKQFQREDIARMALKDGCVLSWSTGLGKSLAAFLLPLVKLGVEITHEHIIPQGTVLFVAPSDLFGQFVMDKQSTASMFYQRVVHLDSQETFLKLSKLDAAGRRVLPRGFYITSYTELTRNKVQECPEEYAENLGEKNSQSVKCVYSPSLADLCSITFDAVIVDEGVRMKGCYTKMGIGLRQMSPRFRCVMTATPIKNRLPDIFQLLVWSCFITDLPTDRFPYSGYDKRCFTEDFVVSEQNFTQEEMLEEATGYHKTVKKFTASITNTHRLWKTLAPIVLRRRKEDAGIDIVPKVYHRLLVPMGYAQYNAYQYHLEKKPEDGMACIMTKLQSLRVCAADPTSKLLRGDTGDGAPGPWRSAQEYTPKLSAVLNLVATILERGEQVVIFSALTDLLHMLSGWLEYAEVPHFVLNGETKPKIRSLQSVEFGKGLRPVMLAGEESAAEGHSWSSCNNAIRAAFSWAYDKGEQCVNRVHRMTSTKPVNIYSVLAQGSIDLKLESTGQEKASASEIALDGKLMTEPVEEINFWEVLESARDAFRDARFTETMDETVLENEWPALKRRLRHAALNWKPQTK